MRSYLLDDTSGSNTLLVRDILDISMALEENSPLRERQKVRFTP